MKQIRTIILTVVASALTCGLGAQTIYDAAALTGKDLNGTARFIAMGGAMGALGGDITTMTTNPAGIAIYRSSDAATSFGLSVYNMDSNYSGNTFSDSKTRGDFNQIGIVLSTKVGTVTALRYLNFGFNYKRVKSFYRDMQMAGALGDFSQTFQMAAQAEGITSWGSNPYRNNDIGWLSVLGYDGYLITDLVAGSDADDYDDVEAYELDGEQATNLDGELVYRTPGYYRGMYTDGTASFLSRERGGIDEFDFNISANINDRVYLGLTLGTYTVNYRKYSFYDETYSTSEGYSLHSWSKIKGYGFDVKMGIIVRPIETSPLRVGLSVQTPVFYDLDYKTSALLQSDVYNDLSVENESGVSSGDLGQYDIDTRSIVGGNMVRSFHLRSPWTFDVSLGYTIGTRWALGAEYEYQDYSSVHFEDIDGYDYPFDYENYTTDMLNGVHTLRLGLEYKLSSEWALRLGYNYRSAIFDEQSYKDLPYNSIQTDTDFANTRSLSHYTAGLGYRGKRVYADVAYKYTRQKADFYPMDMYDGSSLVQATDEKQTRSQVVMTLGVRF